jgi:hypothetical protein
VRVSLTESVPALNSDSQFPSAIVLGIIERKSCLNLSVKSIEHKGAFVLLRTTENIPSVGCGEHDCTKAIVVAELALERYSSGSLNYFKSKFSLESITCWRIDCPLDISLAVRIRSERLLNFSAIIEFARIILNLFLGSTSEYVNPVRLEELFVDPYGVSVLRHLSSRRPTPILLVKKVS